MNQLAIAMKKGFAAEKEDRLSRWTVIREHGYWKPWLQRDIPMTLVVAMIVGVKQQLPADTWIDYIWAVLVWCGIFAFLLLLAEMNLWRDNEKQWKAWRREKAAQHGAP